MLRRTCIAAMLALTTFTAAFAKPANDYAQAIQQTAAMVRDQAAQKLAQSHGLQILNLTWEDTGRYRNSAVGPNISDMTLQIQHNNSLVCMPVIRFPNFEDKTGDIAPEKFFLMIGNEKGQGLSPVSLKEFLQNPTRYLSDPKSWPGKNQSLYAKERDSHVLVSAQACFLPIPREGKAEFNPVLFNYQSVKNDPAVLTILATREGTSVTIIDNQRDGFAAGQTWGQRLFFNQNGERASFTGERLSDFQANPATNNEAKNQKDLNMVLLIQVPLKQKNPPTRGAACDDMAMPSCAPATTVQKQESDVENAVVGHGKVEGPFTEIDGQSIERDERFPVRVTVQFYKATSNGAVSGKDLASIAAQINTVYADADYVGSLVTEGETGRPTEYVGDKNQPADWWQQFWKRHKANTGQSQDDAYLMLRGLLGW